MDLHHAHYRARMTQNFFYNFHFRLRHSQKNTSLTEKLCVLGAPLVINRQLVGLPSYATPCALLQPNVYINVYKYRDWIMGNL